jgi:hypothetical protein
LTCEGIFVDYIDGLGGLEDEHWAGDQEHVKHEHLCIQSTSPNNNSTGTKDNSFQSVNLPPEPDLGLVEGISRCLVLDREDRYLRHPAPRGRFLRDFQAFCLAAIERPMDVDPVFSKWFQRNKSLYIRGHLLGTLCGTAPAPTLSKPTDLMDRSDTERFLARFLDTTMNMARILTVTSQGHIGMAPCRARKGDSICVLLGCSIPVVLRKRNDDPSYEFIGEIYLHGFMDGEIFEEVDSKKREVESFELL